MNYTKYHPTTGEITSRLTITDSASLQANLPDEHYLDGLYHPDQHYIDIATKTPIAKPVKPTANHTWDANNKIWIDADLINRIRIQRNQLLIAIDKINPVWYASLTAEQQQELATYRIALLNVPQQANFPTAIEWPLKPSWL